MTKNPPAASMSVDSLFWPENEVENKENSQQTRQQVVTKSIMKKPGTPIVGKRLRTQALGELNVNNFTDKISKNCDGKEEDDGSLQVMGATSANMGQKRVKFSAKHDKVIEFEV